jgi:hypothetical protein
MIQEEDKAAEIALRLDAIAANLLYPSETDEPFEGFYWLIEKTEGALTKEEVRAILDLPDDVPIEERRFDAFFYPVAVPQDWHSEEELELVNQFQEMIFELRKLLRKPQVFVVGGEVEKEVYIVGKVKEHNFWAGLKTKIVET